MLYVFESSRLLALACNHGFFRRVGGFKEWADRWVYEVWADRWAEGWI
jgi:hypothetical protein